MLADSSDEQVPASAFALGAQRKQDGSHPCVRVVSAVGPVRVREASDIIEANICFVPARAHFACKSLQARMTGKTDNRPNVIKRA